MLKPPTEVCEIAEDYTENITLILYAVIESRLTCVCAITADALVLGATWYQTYRTWRQAVQGGIRVPLSTLLLRDGLSMLPMVKTACADFCVIGTLYFLQVSRTIYSHIYLIDTLFSEL